MVAGTAEARTPRFGTAALGTLASQLVVAAVSFVNVLVVARALGPQGRGELSLLTVMAMLTAGFAAAGVEEATINVAGREAGARPHLATNALVLAAVLGLTGAAILATVTAAAPALAGGTSLGVRLACSAVVPILLAKLFLRFLANAEFGFVASNVAWVLPPMLTLVLNAVLAMSGEMTATRAFGSWIGAHTVACAVLVWWVAARSTGFGRFDAALVRRTLRFGIRSHPGRVLMAGNYRLDQWIVGAVAGTAELGRYAIAVAWAEVLYYVPTVLVLAQRPYLVRADRADAARRAAAVFRLGTLVTAVLAGATVVAAPVLCTVIFGPAFAGAVTDLRVLVLGAFGILSLQVLGGALTAQRFPGRTSLAAAASFVTMVGLGLLLIDPLGGLGAALASVVAYLVGGAATAGLFVRVLGAPSRALVPGRADVGRSLDAFGRAASLLRRRTAVAR